MYKIVYSLSRKFRWKAKEICEFLYRSFPEINNIDIVLDDKQFLMVVRMNSRLEFSILNICQQHGLAMQFVQVEDTN